MAMLICGVGQAGGAIVDEMFAFPNFAKLATPMAINSTVKDLQSLRNIPRANWLGLSEAKGIVRGTTVGFEQLVVGGFGKDPRMAEDLLGKRMEELVDFFKTTARSSTGIANLATKTKVVEADGEGWEVEEKDLGSIPFALIVLGLGGGTGCGASSLIAKAIREASAVSPSIIVVGILPATHDASPEGARGSYRQAWNAIYALNQLEKHVDGFILVDNERLTFTASIEKLFPDFNKYVARSLVDLLSAHALEGVKLTEAGSMSLKVIDVRDVTSAISFGTGSKGRRPGYASIGWAADTTRSYLGYIFPAIGRRHVDCSALLEVALRKQSIKGVKAEDAQKNLGLVRLPVTIARDPKLFPQTGLVESQLGKMTRLKETHFGITLSRRPLVSVNTLFTFERKQIERLQQISDLAARYNEEGVLGL